MIPQHSVTSVSTTNNTKNPIYEVTSPMGKVIKVYVDCADGSVMEIDHLSRGKGGAFISPRPRSKMFVPSKLLLFFINVPPPPKKKKTPGLDPSLNLLYI